MEIKVKDMTQEQITHTFCNWCNCRRFAPGETFWECDLEESTLEENKKEELCLYKRAVCKEEAINK